MSDNQVLFEQKICSPQDLSAAVSRLARPVVFTNGCFDLLHRGHVTYLAQARALGGSLVVALNSDESVKRLGKGDGRPFNTLADRAAVIAALSSSDLVTWFEQDTPLETILQVHPDILVKGGDWEVSKIVGQNEVSSLGGKVVAVPFIHQRSTTTLAERIRSASK